MQRVALTGDTKPGLISEAKQERTECSQSWDELIVAAGVK